MAKRTKKNGKAHRMNDVLIYIWRNDACEQKDVLHTVYRDVADRNYGRQSPASFAIAKLRADGLVEDDCDRCPHCGRAARGRRNVTLSVTKAGAQLAKKLVTGSTVQP